MSDLPISSEALTSGLFKLRFKALGTNCEVQFRGPSVEAAKAFRAESLQWIKEFEKTWSRFKPDSLVCNINRAAGKHSIELTPAQDQIIQLCQYSHDTTDGLLDPTSLPLTNLWDRASQIDQIPTDLEISEVLSLIGWKNIEHQSGEIYLPRKGMALEIGGFGKEYAADKLIAIAKQHGIDSALVDLGRDLATLGSPPHGDYWVLGIEDSRKVNEPLLRLGISGQALATSGNGRRFRMIAGKRFGHIINVQTGFPVDNDVLTATGLAPDCLTAGLFSTSACIKGSLYDINRHFRIEAIVQTKKEVRYSQNIHRHILSK